MPSLLFSSLHNYLDPASGAAISTRETALALVRNGWRVHAFCGHFFDAVEFVEKDFLELLAGRDIKPRVAKYSVEIRNGRRVSFRIFQIDDGGIDATFFIPDDSFLRFTRNKIDREIGLVFLKLFKSELEKISPDVYATYGGYWAARIAVRIARDAGAKTVFCLHNLGYDKAELFEPFDRVVVPSVFARNRYREKLGLESVVIPPIIDEEKVVAKTSYKKRRYATFINPSPEKGLYFFAGLARELARARPDVPLLVVESRVKSSVLGDVVDTRGLDNLYFAPRTPNPSAIYAETKILLAPSVCEETFGRVVAEAAFNGIPTICSDRGALPEIARAGKLASSLVRPIPQRFRPFSVGVPTREEVAPWLEALVKLWDDPLVLENAGRESRISSRRYARAVVEEQTVNFYDNLIKK